MLWKRKFNLADVNKNMENTLSSHLKIKIDEIGEDFLSGTMPVNDFNKQPYGILHGGASVALAETLGSLGSNLAIQENYSTVGLEINANHIKAVKDGKVKGIAKPIHIGRSTHIWQIKIYQESRITCISRLTMAILEMKMPSS
tara:strand:+ start:1266 stop:1694 length:429 start_codon:yes stop_codon:yes gene_type:complete